jgi:hypothetical protein
MALKFNKKGEILGSSETDHTMAVFWDLMAPDQLTTLMMEAAVSSETLVHL